MGLIGKVAGFILEWGARMAAVLALLYSLYVISEGSYLIPWLGSVSPYSLGSASALFLLSQYQFSKGGRGKAESIALGLLFANAFLQVYEIVYHFTFPLLSVEPPFIQGADLRFLISEVVMVLPLALVRRDLSFKKTSLYLLAAFVVSMAVWVLFGFPQYFSTTYYFPPVLHTDDPYHLSLALNFGSKLILAAFFASLLDIWKRGPRAVWGRTAKETPPTASA